MSFLLQESYYCPPSGKHRNASGKLPDKIKNIKYQVKKRAAGSWSISRSEASSLPSENRITHFPKLTGNNCKSVILLRDFIDNLEFIYIYIFFF